jgi:RNA polymerase sigma-70 factor, ECF subfamily
MLATDQDLMAQIQARNTSAFETLMARYQEMLRRHLLRTVRDKDIADDLLQEVFLRVWTRAEQWHGRGAFKGWLFRIATNLALNHIRSVQRHRQQPLEVPASGPGEEDESSMPNWMVDASSLGPDEVLEHAERYELLQRLVGGLPTEKREVFRLVYEAEMDIREVAQTLGIPEGTVKSRLHYATKQVARQWKDQATAWEE